ncbi:uncharacterized protein TNIN_288051 [Trichonephila inaurata madagascariensis]|uniref:Uncharacterized protein n=1 Tax=Trichonephila inaurata madagascariensis TaxID=2747483 RepID=A0A8X7CDV0_9ARAC|nr:uncharacterized protein TNIN_288051 [Trichonephila inaurata madagascariensis]
MICATVLFFKKNWRHKFRISLVKKLLIYPLILEKKILEISKYCDVICAYFEEKYQLVSFRVDNKPGKLPFQSSGICSSYSCHVRRSVSAEFSSAPYIDVESRVSLNNFKKRAGRKFVAEARYDYYEYPDDWYDAESHLNNQYKASTQKKDSKSKLNAYSSKYQAVNKASNLKIDPEMNVCIHGRVKRYEEKWNQFYRSYLFWKKERSLTISKLKELMKKVHEDQLAFNQMNATFKELNINSRKSRDGSNSATDFFASLGTFLSDAASGFTSITQAVSIEKYNTEFKEIMEHDVEITKPLYTARSMCLEQYRNVEEIIRHYHSETFGDTMEKISKALKVEDLWMDLKSAQGENAEYVNINPAALDACKSAGKAIYDAYDTWGRDKKKGLSNQRNKLSVLKYFGKYFLKEMKINLQMHFTHEIKL